jgi:hypothetical protein
MGGETGSSWEEEPGKPGLAASDWRKNGNLTAALARNSERLPDCCLLQTPGIHALQKSQLVQVSGANRLDATTQLPPPKRQRQLRRN